MWTLKTIFICNLVAAATACFTTTEETSNRNVDLSKLRVGSAEACWTACVDNNMCVGADFRQSTNDCWLKAENSLLEDTVGIDSLTPCAAVKRLLINVDNRPHTAPVRGLLTSGDRIAVSADGNFRDEDDIGATPMTFALIAAAAAKDKLVYYGYRSHIWEPETTRTLKRVNGRTQDQRMQAAVREGIPVFGLDQRVFKDEKASYDESGQAAQPELVAAINASGASSRLWIIGAGPMQTIYASMQAADLSALAHVTLVSHSISNNLHAESHKGGVRWEVVKKLLIDNGGQLHYGGRTCSGCVSPTVNQPRDQNALLDFRKADDPLEVWTWLRDSSDTRLNFVFDKIKDSNVGDVSDAGMVYYILTGDEDADPRKLRTFLEGMPAPSSVSVPAPSSVSVPAPSSVSDSAPSAPTDLATPKVNDFVHRPAVFSGLTFEYNTVDASKMTLWKDCVRACIDTYGAQCLYVQFDLLTPEGTCIISRPCTAGAVCSKVADVNKRGRDFNRVNCKSVQYLELQGRVDSGVEACRNVFR